VQMLAGEYGFIAQLNEGRHLKKRATEFRVDQVLQPFDPAKFNFTKVGKEEVLFRFEQSEDGHSEYYEYAPVSESPNVVIINVSTPRQPPLFRHPIGSQASGPPVLPHI
jgi:GDP-L-galactose phosphorylase